MGSSGIVRRRLGAPALHLHLRISSLDRLPRGAGIDGPDLPGDLISDLAVGRGFEDRPRASRYCARLVAAVFLPFLRGQYDRTNLRAGLCHRAAIASPRTPQGGNDRGFTNDSGAARRILYGSVVGSLGIDGGTGKQGDKETRRQGD